MAAESAFSLPLRPVWLGTQQKTMSFLAIFKKHTFVSPSQSGVVMVVVIVVMIVVEVVVVVVVVVFNDELYIFSYDYITFNIW